MMWGRWTCRCWFVHTNPHWGLHLHAGARKDVLCGGGGRGRGAGGRAGAGLWKP